jgi:hypothetical protein
MNVFRTLRECPERYVQSAIGEEFMEKREYFRTLFWFSIVTSIFSSTLLLGVSVFRWNLVDILTPLFAPLLEIVVWGLAIITLIWGLVYLFVAVKRDKLLAAIPLLICLSVMIAAYFVPFTKLAINHDFTSNLSERTIVIQQIKSGQLKPNASNNEMLVNLPTEHTHLSKGGGQVLYKNSGTTTSVFFYTFRGIMDNFSGFIYISDNGAPSQNDFGGDFIEIIKLRDHWFWAASR